MVDFKIVILLTLGYHKLQIHLEKALFMLLVEQDWTGKALFAIETWEVKVGCGQLRTSI